MIVLISGVIIENIIIYRRLIHSEWRCEKCGTTFKPKFSQVLFSINAGDVKIMRAARIAKASRIASPSGAKSNNFKHH